jgi:hypothetical protein
MLRILVLALVPIISSTANADIVWSNTFDDGILGHTTTTTLQVNIGDDIVFAGLDVAWKIDELINIQPGFVYDVTADSTQYDFLDWDKMVSALRNPNKSIWMAAFNEGGGGLNGVLSPGISSEIDIVQLRVRIDRIRYPLPDARDLVVTLEVLDEFDEIIEPSTFALMCMAGAIGCSKRLRQRKSQVSGS